MMAMRRVRCGSSVYVQKKSSWSWAACACCFSAVTVKLRLAGCLGGTVAVVVEARIAKKTGATTVAIERESVRERESVCVCGLASVCERCHVEMSVNAELPWTLRTRGETAVWAERRPMVGCTHTPPATRSGARGARPLFILSHNKHSGTLQTC